MRRDTKKKRQAKCNTQEDVWARPVRPIIFSPSLMRNSFSFTSWLIVFATGYMIEMTTRMANAKPAFVDQQYDHEQDNPTRKSKILEGLEGRREEGGGRQRAAQNERGEDRSTSILI